MDRTAYSAHVADQMTSFAHVSGPTIPSTASTLAFWNDTTADLVPVPKAPPSALVDLDFLVDDLAATEARVLKAAATKQAFQPNVEYCLVFADPVGHPFCLTTLDEIE